VHKWICFSQLISFSQKAYESSARRGKKIASRSIFGNNDRSAASASTEAKIHQKRVVKKRNSKSINPSWRRDERWSIEAEWLGTAMIYPACGGALLMLLRLSC
jgi:hypothetical protein